MIIIHTMNDNHSQHELKYKPRWLASPLRDAVNDHPVIVLTGARQVGKSTLLLQEFPFSDWRYVSMDDLEALAQALQTTSRTAHRAPSSSAPSPRRSLRMVSASSTTYPNS